MVLQTGQKKPTPASVATAAKAAAGKGAEKKSGLKRFKPGDVLFNEKDPADSLYIIQRGQIRLFLPKGRGFVDIAILRSGEVIGEMAYFDERASKRSCSAAAIVSTEVVEISFAAFGKTMSGLNPWFKTIINTLAERLRKTNDKVKQLESNSVGFGEGGKVADYKFLHSSDIVKILALVYMTMKAHGEVRDGATQLSLKQFKLYAMDMFNIQEIKYEEFFHLMVNANYVEIVNDKNNLPNILRVRDVEMFRSMMLHTNTQRLLTDDKKMTISPKCEVMLKGVINQLKEKTISEDGMAVANITELINDFKQKKLVANEDDLKDAINAGLCEDLIVGAGNSVTSTVNYNKLKTVLPSIKMDNAIKALNESKVKKNY